MSTKIRPEVSKKKDYYISKERMYELRHFCLQYPEWKKAYNAINSLAASTREGMPKSSYISDPTEKAAEDRMYYYERISMVEECCMVVGNDIWKYLLKGVTEGLSYPVLNPPCCKEVYYGMYRRFFWLLDMKRK